MRVPHPIPYQGSKRRLADVILRYFPSNVEVLIEPFAGSAAVSLAAASRKMAKQFLLNDTNPALMALWAEICNAPEALAHAYAELWHAQQGRERAFYDEVRDRFNKAARPADFLYLLARCVKASVRYNAGGEFNQSPDNRRQGARPSTMMQHIMRASQLLHGRTTITSGDYEEALREATPEDLVYMDPPYQGVSQNRDPRYLGSISSDRFVEVLGEANSRGLSYLVSYDGRTGTKEFGKPLPNSLRLVHIEVDAGRSSQATLLGRDARTVESLYLSPALADRIAHRPGSPVKGNAPQMPLLEMPCPETITPLSSSSVWPPSAASAPESSSTTS